MKDKKLSLWSQIYKEKGLLFVCFVLAFLAWQGIRKDIGFEVSVSNIAVDIEAPAGWAVWEKSVQQVNIAFRGSREDIRYLNADQLRVVVPVETPVQGEEIRIKLSGNFLQNPTGAKVVRFSPAEIVIKLDQEMEKTLPVKAAFNGSLPAGMEIERIVCTPASVRVSGARQILDDMKNIHTDAIELKGRNASFKESMAIALPQVGRMRVEPERVMVEFVLEQRSSTQVFEKVPVRILCAPGERRQFNIEPQTINVTAQGREQRLEQSRSADVFAYVSCSELDESTGYDLPVEVNLPTGLQIIKTDPSVVHVEIGNSN